MASPAMERLRAIREQARQQREATRKAVERLRQRNREESRLVVERAAARRRPAQRPWPAAGQPREMHLYDTDEADEPEVRDTQQQRPRPAARQQPPGPPDDDWSHESWLH